MILENIKFIYPNEKKNEEEWFDWLKTKGAGLLQLPLPPSALKDNHFFCDFVYNYADRCSIEPFSIEILTDQQALQLLCILESYFFDYAFRRMEEWGGDDRNDARLYVDLHSHFNLLDNQWPHDFVPVPKELLIAHGILDCDYVTYGFPIASKNSAEKEGE